MRPTATALFAFVTFVAVATVACQPTDPQETPATQATAERAEPARRAPPAATRTVTPAPRGETGTITAVVPVREAAPPSGAGAVIGGVVGGALGNSVGKGDGRKAATVLGAVGGAVAGHQIEKDRNTRITGYRVEVRLDDGRQASVTLADPAGLASGQRVRMVDGRLVPT